MQMMKWTGWFTGCLLLSALPVATQASDQVEQIQLSSCLAAKINTSYKVLAENNQFKIIEISSNALDALAHLADSVDCGRFVNVSAKLSHSSISAASLLQPRQSAFISSPYEIAHPEAVKAAMKAVVSDNIWDTLTQLTSFNNRSSTKDTGVKAAAWLKSDFESMAREYGRTDVETYYVKTGSYKQPSLVTVIGKDIKAPAIVIGAHMDTLDGHMPGAGDDGSGSASVMEMARVMLASELSLKRPVYFIWYAAEERGLVGSQYVVEAFKKKSIPVKAAIQFDMTGFRNDMNDQTMWVYRDYTDKALSNFVANLITTYVKVPVDSSACGYGCSDHASWHEEGIPAAFPCETNFEDHNPYIHSSSDTMDLLSLEHMTNFTKLGLAFAIELALA